MEQNIKLEEFKSQIKGKRVAVLGIGISHRPLIGKLCEYGANVYAFDAKEVSALESVKEMCSSYIERGNLRFVCGADYLSKLNDNKYDYVFRTPGMRPDKAEIVEAVSNGAVLTSEMETFFELCPAEIFGITGSDGKTTTTTLVYEFLKEEGYNCFVGGNIGLPLFDRLEEMKSDDKIIVELSSFQLMTMTQSPNVSVITNLSPNHLDIHKNVEEYYDAKKNILNNATRVVLNYDNQLTKAIGENVSVDFSKKELVWFGRQNRPICKDVAERALFVEDGYIKVQNGQIGNDDINCENNTVEVLNTEEIRVPGVHNVENFMTAIGAVLDFVSIDSIKAVATRFIGVAHRIEFVREFNGVKFYNDSIASSPNRTIAGLNSFDRKVILLAGGKDKGIPYDEIGKPIVDHVKKLVLIGPTAQPIHDAVCAAMKDCDDCLTESDIFFAENYNQLVGKAVEIAEKGDVVILSPASTSFDMFANFEQRGNKFKEIVNKLQ